MSTTEEIIASMHYLIESARKLAAIALENNNPAKYIEWTRKLNERETRLKEMLSQTQTIQL